MQEVEAAMQGLQGKWPSVQLTEEEVENWRENLFRSEARPLVLEEIRLAVDAEMRISLHQSKVPSTPKQWRLCQCAARFTLCFNE